MLCVLVADADHARHDARGNDRDHVEDGERDENAAHGVDDGARHVDELNVARVLEELAGVARIARRIARQRAAAAAGRRVQRVVGQHVAVPCALPAAALEVALKLVALSPLRTRHVPAEVGDERLLDKRGEFGARLDAEAGDAREHLDEEDEEEEDTVADENARTILESGVQADDREDQDGQAEDDADERARRGAVAGDCARQVSLVDLTLHGRAGDEHDQAAHEDDHIESDESALDEQACGRNGHRSSSSSSFCRCIPK